MDEEDFFQDSNKNNKLNQIIEANKLLSALNIENYEQTLYFFQSSIFFTNKKLTKTFIRSVLNIIRFRTKNLNLYASLCQDLNSVSDLIGHILIEFLKYADFMTPSQFKFYRICLSNNLISSFDVIKQISVILYVNLTNDDNSSSIKHLIPLFLWFLPEMHKYSNKIYQLFLQNCRKIEYFQNQVELLKSNNWCLFNQYVEHQYINLKFYKQTDENQEDLTELTQNSIEYCLQNDDVDQFQQLTENIKLNKTCNISLFDLLLPTDQHPTFLQFAALHSSIKCIKFLMVNDIDMSIVASNMSTSHLYAESLPFNQRNQIENQNTNQQQKAILDTESDENDGPEIIEVGSSSTESESEKEASNDENKNEDEKENDDVIFIDDSDSNDDEIKEKEKENEQKNNEINDEKEIIVISSDDEENNDSSSNQQNQEKQKHENNGTVDLDEIKEKSSRLLVPPIHPYILTASVDSNSMSLNARKPLCIEYESSMKITTTPQYAVAGGNLEIIRLVYDASLSFIDTPRVAISCFYNDIAKWLIDVVLSSENENDEKTKVSLKYLYSSLLHHSITTGNIEMMKNIIISMPGDINDKINSLNFIPLHLAIRYHQIDILSFLLNMKSIDVNVIDTMTKKSPFYLAIDQKSLEMTKMIASHPLFNFNHITCDTLKPIHYAALYGTSKIMKFLVTLDGIDINDNLSDKLEIKRKEKINNKKKNKKLKEKISKNFLDDSQLMFFDDEVVTKEEDKNDSNVEEEEEISFEKSYYYDYTADLYDPEHRNFYLASQKDNEDRVNFGNLLNTPIVCTLITENIDNFFILLKDKNLKINTRSDQMLLHLCIKQDFIQIFDYLLSTRDKTEIDIDAYDRCGTTPLHYSILKKKKWAIDALLKAGCDVTKRTICEGDTILHVAAFIGCFEAFKKFIKLKNGDQNVFDLNVTNDKNQTILHYAAIYGATQIVSLLLSQKDIDVNARDIEGNTALHYSIQSSQQHIFESLVSSHLIDINATNNKAETPLIVGFKFNNITAIKKLLSLNGVINPNCFENETQNTPLHLAVLAKNENLVRLILKLHKPAFNINENDDQSDGRMNHYKNSFNYEFDPEADVNLQNFQGMTPLHIAAQIQSDILVRVLLMSPNIRLDILDYKEGRCPLHYSAVNTRNGWFGMKMFNPYMYDMTKFSNTVFSQLINRDPLTGNIQDNNGDTAFHIALNERGFDGNLLKTAAMQLNRYAPIRTEKEEGTDMIIVDSDNEDNGESLNLTLRNNRGETYLHLAAGSGNRIVLDYMLKTHPELINEKTIDVLFILFMEFLYL